MQTVEHINEPLFLSSDIMLLSDYRGKSKFPIWKNAKKGDWLNLKIKIADPGRGRSLYATMVEVRNVTSGDTGTFGLNETSKYLDNLDYQKIINHV